MLDSALDIRHSTLRPQNLLVFSAIAVLGLVACWSPPAALADPAPTTAPERLLLGFEDAEIRKLDAAIQKASGDKASHIKPATQDGESILTMTLFAQNQGVWHLFSGTGNPAGGQYALGIGKTRGVDEMPFAYWQPPASSPPPADAKLYYGIFHDNYASADGRVLNTCGLFRALFPADWSAYDRLRLDVFCRDVAQTVRVQIEDEEVAPPVMRSFRVEPGKWSTLDFDLRQAVKDRRLDLKRMTTLTVGVSELHGKTSKPFPCLIDNLRLATAAAPAKLPVVTDLTPMTLPDYYRTNTKPKPEQMPAGTPDRAPLKLQPPFVVPTEKPARTFVGWAAAYDNRRLLVGFNDGSHALALQSLDEGKTWRGLDGGEKPTWCPSTAYVDHQCGHGDVVGQRPDLVLLASNGCNSGGQASLRTFAQTMVCGGATGWKLNPPVLADCDPRHCTSLHSVVRTADGRLWAGYGLASRLGTRCINVRISDDNGATWKTSREYTSGLIPWSLWPSDEPVGGYTYTFEQPCLVPFGEGVACFVQTRTRKDAAGLDKLVWSRFDSKKGQWTAPEVIEIPKWTHYYELTRPLVKAVSPDAKEIFLISALVDGVMHYKDGKWTREAEDVPGNSGLCLAGGKTVVAIGAVCASGDPKKGPVTFRRWQRKADGDWSKGVEVAREDLAIAQNEDAGFVVPAVSPPNFVPMIWSAGQKWVKFLRVPVEE